jgi:hypothetical protein
VLTRGGLRAGVAALASRMTVPVKLDVSAVRAPQPIEATAYFVVAEALTNVAEHARDGHGARRQQRPAIRGARRRRGRRAARWQRPDWPARPPGGTRRTLTVDSPPGGGTVVTATIPLPAPA